MSIPELNIDLFAEDTLRNTPAVYRELRGAGAAVSLPKNDLFAITHFAAVRAALRADDQLVSSHGVAANDIINSIGGTATLTSDGDTHKRRRSVLTRPLSRTALEGVQHRINSTAEALVRTLLAKGSFCGVNDFAAHLPLNVVAELVGLEESGREQMLSWAAATFDALGPENSRTFAALETALGLFEYVQGLGPETVNADGWAAAALSEVESGVLSPEEAAGMIIDYTAPSLDTTILATAHMLWRLSVTDGAFETLKEHPEFIGSTVLESVRLASPIRGFTRFVKEDYDTGAGTIPAGARVAVLYASGNWDDNHYERASQFLLDRNPRDHVGWGHGTHSCAGMHLARMEMEALLRALLKHVARIETEEPEPILNNVLQGFGALPTRFHAG
ncbi:MAG: cytochrome P450 [Pseudomonadota bacterium]